jgi:hypothetical protein
MDLTRTPIQGGQQIDSSCALLCMFTTVRSVVGLGWPGLQAPCPKRRMIFPLRAITAARVLGHYPRPKVWSSRERQIMPCLI